MNEFTEKFTSYSNTDLLKIIDRPEKYQPEAVQTAITILNSRELSPEEYEKAKEELESERLASIAETEKQQLPENKINTAASPVTGIFRPFQKSGHFIDKGINLIVLCCTLLFAFYLYRRAGYIGYLFDSNDANTTTILLYFFYFIDLIYLPIGTFLLYRRKKTGWLLIVYFCIRSIISYIVSLKIKMEIPQENNSLTLESLRVQNSVIDLVWIVFFGAVLWFLWKEGIRKMYTVSNKTVVWSIVISLAIALLASQRII